ncbi:serine/threonine protein kinase [Rhizobium glycinendophyticum]|uniref:Serine/threonine protein kinase n=1 Tax=Rhizobium glycinendophyticum TaxID=2589807 RepID=A0A504U434_9HYPH|nr:bifunctional serine/threonine-protein kinase/universal stress protein [Rhizobium glycinendophyticum]TPP09764.1 serine/threonine protein kinase [Rhizobium glycinendophyticum]
MARTRIDEGDVIDGFTLGKLAHTGGMAKLYEVTHPDHTGPLLMKVPRIGSGTDPATIVGFEMELMILPRISGPHVPRFVARGDFSRQPYIVVERLPGKSLYPMLERLPCSQPEVVETAAKIATALTDLHRQKVVHLDIKPSNILFRDTGEAVLVDYGLARHLELPDLMDEEFRLPYGTAPYMAPEQILGVRSDFRSDLFALGVLMYFFSTGRRPFGDPQRMNGLKKRLWWDPPPPRELNPMVSKACQEIILRCLEVNPARRYQTAAQLALDLGNLYGVRLTARAEKTSRDGWRQVVKRMLNPDPIELIKPKGATALLASAPIVMVAIDLNAASQELAEALRETAKRIIRNSPHARIACVNVLKIARLALDDDLDAEGNSKHVMRLAALKHWAAPLGADEADITYHVLEAVSPAQAILTFARDNNVDHVVMGARANSTLRSLMGSVSGEVAASAPCSVTVVRVRGASAPVAKQSSIIEGETDLAGHA